MLAGEPIPVARLALTGEAGPSATMIAARQEGAMRYLILTKTATGLGMRPTEEGLAEAIDLVERGRAGDDGLYDMLEHELGNGWSNIPPEAIGALTSAPIISEDSILTDDGGVDFHWDIPGGPCVYAHMNYQVESPVETWARGGSVFWIRSAVERPAPPPPRLTRGSHRSFEEGTCLLEWVAHLAGEGHSASPACVSSVIASFAPTICDGMPSDEERDRLFLPLAASLIGTVASLAHEVRRAEFCADFVLRRVVVPLLRNAGLATEAEKVEALADVSDDDSAILAYGALVHVTDVAWGSQSPCTEADKATLSMARHSLSWRASVPSRPDTLLLAKQTAYYASVAIASYPSTSPGRGDTAADDACRDLVLRLALLLPVEETRRRIAALPLSERCHDDCRVWDVANGCEIQACNSCVSRMAEGQRVSDDDVALLPEAIAELKTVRAAIALSEKEDSSGTK